MILRVFFAGLALAAVGAEPVAYRHETRQQPRPLQIHILTADLRAVDPVVLIAPDPDGDGPAEAQLVKPLALAGPTGLLAAVNANAFAHLTEKGGPWTNGLPVNICGWAFDGNRQASPPETNYASFWVAPDGTGHIGQPATNPPARVAVAGFKPVLRAGEVCPPANEALHPRTAVGLDRAGRQLWLVVVDGRQKGYSEGVSLAELGALMQELGCWDALNLDGGGSSLLLLATNETGLAIMNRPSDPETRPVPVMLGLRRRPLLGR